MNFELEPHNRHDRNAIGIFRLATDEQVGYVDRDVAAKLYPLIVDFERRGVVPIVTPCVVIKKGEMKYGEWKGEVLVQKMYFTADWFSNPRHLYFHHDD